LRSKLDRSKVGEPRHAALRALHTDLLRLRREHPALRPGGARVTVAELALPGTMAHVLSPVRGGARLLALFNTSDAAHAVRSDVAALGGARVVLSTSDPRYGGPGAAHLDPGFTFSGSDAVIDLPPDSAVLLRSEPLAASHPASRP
jgi:hypothetical protein